MNARRLKLLGIWNANNISIKSTMYLNINLVNFYLFRLREYNGYNIIIIDNLAIMQLYVKIKLILKVYFTKLQLARAYFIKK